MTKRLILAAALIGTALVGMAPAQAFSVNFEQGSSALGSTVVFENYDSYNNGDLIGGAGQVFDNSVSGIAARPAVGSTGNFLAVLANKIYNVSFAAVQVFSFQIGSLDTFNQVTLHFADSSTMILKGKDIIQLEPANGDQVAANTNGRVFYDAQGGSGIVGATFESFGANAFEIDDLASAVPEPVTWGLMLVAAGIAGAGLRRRRVSSAAMA